MGKGANGACVRYSTPKRNAGLPRRLDDDFALDKPKCRTSTPRVRRASEKPASPPPVPKRQRNRPGKHSAFFESSWPSTATQLWSWVPITNHLDDIEDSDLELLKPPVVGLKSGDHVHAADLCRPLPDGSEPVGQHYTATWLLEDAQDLSETRAAAYGASTPLPRESNLLGQQSCLLPTVAAAPCRRSEGPGELKSPGCRGALAAAGRGKRVEWSPARVQDSEFGEMPPGSDLGPISPMTDYSCPGDRRPNSRTAMGAPGTPAGSPCPEQSRGGIPDSGTATARPMSGRQHRTVTRRSAEKCSRANAPSALECSLEFTGARGSFDVVASYSLGTPEWAACDAASYRLQMPAPRPTESDEIAAEIRRLRGELDAAVERHEPMRAALRARCVEDMAHRNRLRELKNEEVAILDRLRQVQADKAGSRQATGVAKQATPKVAASRGSRKAGDPSPKRQAGASSRAKGQAGADTVREMLLMRELREDLCGLNEMTKRCLHREVLKREATELRVGGLGELDAPAGSPTASEPPAAER